MFIALVLTANLLPAQDLPKAPHDSAAHALDSVHVTAARVRPAGYLVHGVRSATRTDTPLRDLPQSVSIVSRALVADRAMQSMADVARFLPGVSMAAGEGHRDAPIMRGIGSTADLYVDGVRDDAQYLRDLYNTERIEVLKGPNAMSFGRGGGGGVINRVSKEASWHPAQSVTYEGGSFDHRRGSIDVGEAQGPVAFRLNAVRERSSRFRQFMPLDRRGVNPTLALLAGQAVVRVGYEEFADHRTLDRGQPSFAGAPAPVDPRTIFGDPSVNRSRAVVRAWSATVERGTADGVLLRNTTRRVTYDKQYQNTVPGAVNADMTTVALTAYRNATDRVNLFNQTDLTTTRRTGRVTHTLLAGAEFGTQRTENYRETGYFNGTATSMSVPFDAPTVRAPVGFRQSATDADNQTRADVAAAYVQHQAALGTHWQTTAGLRWDRLALRYHNRRTGASLGRDDKVLSPRMGLVFKPAPAVSLYASYGTSYLPGAGDQFSSLTATTATLAPERFVNREAGAKWALGPALLVDAAVYQLDRTNTSSPDPVTPGKLVQTGRQRSSGVELQVSGSITDSWQLVTGFASQRATITSRTSAARQGASVPLVPHVTFSAWNRVQLARALGVGVGVVQQGRSYAAINNTVRLPSFTRVDGALYVRLGRRARAQVNVENVLDRRYTATSQGNDNIVPGAPRTVLVSVTVMP
ncbi:MAG: TonB-dependent receptor [Gemmatimonadaceae bacterium]